jgi:WD40 repeat protein
VTTLAGHINEVFSVAFHPTAPVLVTGSGDDTLSGHSHISKLWRLSSGNTSATCVATLEGNSRPDMNVTSVAFHPTAPLLATGSEDKIAKLWRLSSDNSSATCVATLAGHSSSVTSVAFHPTAPVLATGSQDDTAKLWRLPSGNSLRVPIVTCVATLAGHRDHVTSVAFHPTAPVLATGSRDNTAKLWHLSSDNSSATCVATLTGHRKISHNGGVTSVAFHPTAPLLATGREDKIAKLWRLSSDNSSATCVATLAGHSSSVTSVAFHPTAPVLVTGSRDNTAKLWRFNFLRNPRLLC